MAYSSPNLFGDYQLTSTKPSDTLEHYILNTQVVGKQVFCRRRGRFPSYCQITHLSVPCALTFIDVHVENDSIMH